MKLHGSEAFGPGDSRWPKRMTPCLQQQAIFRRHFLLQQPLSRQEILDRASEIKRILYIDDEQGENIKQATKSQ